MARRRYSSTHHSRQQHHHNGCAQRLPWETFILKDDISIDNREGQPPLLKKGQGDVGEKKKNSGKGQASVLPSRRSQRIRRQKETLTDSETKSVVKKKSKSSHRDTGEVGEGGGGGGAEKKDFVVSEEIQKKTQKTQKQHNDEYHRLHFHETSSVTTWSTMDSPPQQTSCFSPMSLEMSPISEHDEEIVMETNNNDNDAGLDKDTDDKYRSEGLGRWEKEQQQQQHHPCHHRHKGDEWRPYKTLNAQDVPQLALTTRSQVRNRKRKRSPAALKMMITEQSGGGVCRRKRSRYATTYYYYEYNDDDDSSSTDSSELMPRNARGTKKRRIAAASCTTPTTYTTADYSAYVMPFRGVTRSRVAGSMWSTGPSPSVSSYSPTLLFTRRSQDLDHDDDDINETQSSFAFAFCNALTSEERMRWWHTWDQVDDFAARLVYTVAKEQQYAARSLNGNPFLLDHVGKTTSDPHRVSMFPLDAVWRAEFVRQTYKDSGAFELRSPPPTYKSMPPSGWGENEIDHEDKDEDKDQTSSSLSRTPDDALPDDNTTVQETGLPPRSSFEVDDEPSLDEFEYEEDDGFYQSLQNNVLEHKEEDAAIWPVPLFLDNYEEEEEEEDNNRDGVDNSYTSRAAILAAFADNDIVGSLIAEIRSSLYSSSHVYPYDSSSGARQHRVRSQQNEQPYLGATTCRDGQYVYLPWWTFHEKDVRLFVSWPTHGGTRGSGGANSISHVGSEMIRDDYMWCNTSIAAADGIDGIDGGDGGQLWDETERVRRWVLQSRCLDSVFASFFSQVLEDAHRAHTSDSSALVLAASMVVVGKRRQCRRSARSTVFTNDNTSSSFVRPQWMVTMPPPPVGRRSMSSKRKTTLSETSITALALHLLVQDWAVYPECAALSMLLLVDAPWILLDDAIWFLLGCSGLWNSIDLMCRVLWSHPVLCQLSKWQQQQQQQHDCDTKKDIAAGGEEMYVRCMQMLMDGLAVGQHTAVASMVRKCFVVTWANYASRTDANNAHLSREIDSVMGGDNEQGRERTSVVTPWRFQCAHSAIAMSEHATNRCVVRINAVLQRVCQYVASAWTYVVRHRKVQVRGKTNKEKSRTWYRSDITQLLVTRLLECFQLHWNWMVVRKTSTGTTVLYPTHACHVRVDHMSEVDWDYLQFATELFIRITGRHYDRFENQLQRQMQATAAASSVAELKPAFVVLAEMENETIRRFLHFSSQCAETMRTRNLVHGDAAASCSAKEDVRANLLWSWSATANEEAQACTEEQKTKKSFAAMHKFVPTFEDENDVATGSILPWRTSRAWYMVLLFPESVCKRSTHLFQTALSEWGINTQFELRSFGGSSSSSSPPPFLSVVSISSGKNNDD